LHGFRFAFCWFCFVFVFVFFFFPEKSQKMEDEFNPFAAPTPKKGTRGKRSPNRQKKEEGGVFIPLSSPTSPLFPESSPPPSSPPPPSSSVGNSSVGNSSVGNNNNDAAKLVVFSDGRQLSLHDALQVKDAHFFTLSYYVGAADALTQEILDNCSVFGVVLPVKANAPIMFQKCAAWEPEGVVSCSDAGMCEFIACLHVLAKHIVHADAVNLGRAVLAMGCFPPAAFALLRLLISSGSHQSLNAIEKTLVSMELFKVFRKMVDGGEDSLVFERSRVVFAHLLQISVSESVCAVEDVQMICSRCPGEPLVDPVVLADGSLCSESRVEENEAFQPANDVRLFLKMRAEKSTTFYRCTLGPVVLLTPTFVKASEALFKDKGTLLRIVPPLSLKSSNVPVLTKNRSNVTVVCTARGGGCGEVDAALSIKLLDCKTGQEVGIDPHELAKVLSDQGCSQSLRIIGFL
jgi:hypothetical protein